MARSGFKLKSGNNTGASSFKAMGATPVQSPMQLGGIIKGAKLIYRAITGTRKVKQGQKIRNLAEEVADQSYKITKSGRLTSQSLKQYKKLSSQINAHNAGATQIPIRYGGSDFVIDAYTGYQGSKIWWNDETKKLEGTNTSTDYEGTSTTIGEGDTSYKVFEGINYDQNTNQFSTED